MAAAAAAEEMFLLPLAEPTTITAIIHTALRRPIQRRPFTTVSIPTVTKMIPTAALIQVLNYSNSHRNETSCSSSIHPSSFFSSFFTVPPISLRLTSETMTRDFIRNDILFFFYKQVMEAVWIVTVTEPIRSTAKPRLHRRPSTDPTATTKPDSTTTTSHRPGRTTRSTSNINREMVGG